MFVFVALLLRLSLKNLLFSVIALLIFLTEAGCSKRQDTASNIRPAAVEVGDVVSKSDEVLPGLVAAKSKNDLQPSKPTQSAGIRHFSVMSWNLEWFFDNESGDNYSKLAKEQTAASRARWEWKRDAVAASIAKAQPSVVAFQEIENRRVLWYLARAIARDNDLEYQEICSEGDDVFTEQDVGFVYRLVAKTAAKSGAICMVQPILVSTFGRTAAMQNDDSLAEVSKHLAVEYELSSDDQTERVTIVTIHLRAKEEAVGIRTKQARTVHAWVADKIRAGENVIVLGDFNTEEEQIPAIQGSDMYAACGFETPDKRDDLVDLHSQLPKDQRQTHLLAGKSFDRILVSPSLLEDSPDRVDLSLAKIQRLQELSANGSVDVPDDHWNKYWELDDANRDISDHWPIMATFQFK